MTKRGKCSDCGFSFPLRKDGTVQAHRLFSGRDRLPPCEGSGKPPPLVQVPVDLAAVNADLRRQLECEHAVALELIAERDRAVEELGRLQQLSLLAEAAS